MNIAKLKASLEDSKTAYFDIKRIYDQKQDELTKKEYQLTALITQNSFLEEFIEKHATKFEEVSDGLKVNLEKIDKLGILKNSLEKDIGDLEGKYDEEVIQVAKVREELRQLYDALG